MECQYWKGIFSPCVLWAQSKMLWFLEGFKCCIPGILWGLHSWDSDDTDWDLKSDVSFEPRLKSTQNAQEVQPWSTQWEKREKQFPKIYSCVIWDLQYSLSCSVSTVWRVCDQFSMWVVLKRSGKRNKASFVHSRHICRVQVGKLMAQKQLLWEDSFQRYFLCFHSMCQAEELALHFTAVPL